MVLKGRLTKNIHWRLFIPPSFQSSGSLSGEAHPFLLYPSRDVLHILQVNIKVLFTFIHVAA